MRQKLTTHAFILILFHNLISGHGFGGSTYVKTSLHHCERIEQIVEHAETQSIISYRLENQQRHSHKILARARSTTNCYFTINLDHGPSVDIICSPLQQFYLPEKHCWIPAHLLQVGDILLTERKGNLPIVRIAFIEQPLELYALKIEHPHTFFVGRHSVLTHNMDLPIASFCWQIPATITAVGATGGILTGFMTAASGIAVGAIAASLIYSAVKEHKAKKYHEVHIPKDAILSFTQKQTNTNKIVKEDLYHLRSDQIGDLLSKLVEQEKKKEQKPPDKAFIYKIADYHPVVSFKDIGVYVHSHTIGNKSPCPTLIEGQTILTFLSFPAGDRHRIAYVAGYFIEFRLEQEMQNHRIYHGYYNFTNPRQMDYRQKLALEEHGIINGKGRVIV